MQPLILMNAITGTKTRMERKKCGVIHKYVEGLRRLAGELVILNDNMEYANFYAFLRNCVTHIFVVETNFNGFISQKPDSL